MLDVRDLEKSFILHLQGGVRLDVANGVGFTVEPGECVVLRGPSGAGKSTLLKLIYGTYRAGAGSIRVAHDGGTVDLVTAPPRQILAVRARSLGYVSQFLRCLPRLGAATVVAEPLLAQGADRDEALDRARALLARLAIPESHWGLAPATFSGGEQQRVNIARGFVHPYPVLLLDEPTASLDAVNRGTVVELIGEAKARGAAILGIFHDADVRDAVADRVLEVRPLQEAA